MSTCKSYSSELKRGHREGRSKSVDVGVSMLEHVVSTGMEAVLRLVVSLASLVLSGPGHL